MTVFHVEASGSHSVFLAMTATRTARLAAIGLAAGVMSCAEPPMTPQPPTVGMRRGPALTARAASEVVEMLGDAKARVADALDDATARTELSSALDLMIRNIDAGQIDAVARTAADVRAALARAAAADTEGAGAADRDAIGLALDAVDEIIAAARS